MTILAQFNNCHYCNDARSLVQKKILGGCIVVWLVFLFEFFRCCFQLVFDTQYHSDTF